LLIGRMGLGPIWRAYTPDAMLKPMIEWEPDVSRVLRQIKADVFVDVGCNVGYYARLLRGTAVKARKVRFQLDDPSQELGWHLAFRGSKQWDWIG